MPKQFDSLNARVTQDASEVKKQRASTSFDFTRFLAGSKAKSEETQASATADEGYYTKNEILAQRDLKRAKFDQEQWAKHPREKVILAKDNLKGGTREEAKEFLDDLKERNKPQWDEYKKFISSKNQYEYQVKQGTYQDDKGRSAFKRAGDEEPVGREVHRLVVQIRKRKSMSPKTTRLYNQFDSEAGLSAFLTDGYIALSGSDSGSDSDSDSE